mgnify:CR=1 FL=1
MTTYRRPRGTASGRLMPVAVLVVGCVLMAFGLASVALYVPPVQLSTRSTIMAASFIPYGLPCFAVATLVFAVSQQRWAKLVAVVALAGVLLLAWWAKPYWPKQMPHSTTQGMTLLTMNMRCDSRGLQDLDDLLHEMRPDVAVIQGLQITRHEEYQRSWEPLLPHREYFPMESLPGCGTFVMTRWPVRSLPGVDGAVVTGEFPVVQVGAPDGSFVLLPVDFPTPSKGPQLWLDAFEQLSKVATNQGNTPVVVMGDFNAVREHVPLRRLLQRTELRDAAEAAGQGWLPTFPSRGWRPALIGVDHVLVTREFEALEATTARISGQGHRAVIVRMAVPPSPSGVIGEDQRHD